MIENFAPQPYPLWAAVDQQNGVWQTTRVIGWTEHRDEYVPVVCHEADGVTDTALPSGYNLAESRKRAMEQCRENEERDQRFAAAERRERIPAVLAEAVRTTPGISRRDLREAVCAQGGVRRETVDRAICGAIDSGTMRVDDGRHYLAADDTP